MEKGSRIERQVERSVETPLRGFHCDLDNMVHTAVRYCQLHACFSDERCSAAELQHVTKLL